MARRKGDERLPPLVDRICVPLQLDHPFDVKVTHLDLANVRSVVEGRHQRNAEARSYKRERSIVLVCFVDHMSSDSAVAQKLGGVRKRLAVRTNDERLTLQFIDADTLDH